MRDGRISFAKEKLVAKAPQSEGEKLRAALEAMGSPAIPSTLVLTMIETQTRMETKLDTVVSEQERARNQREQMFERFDEQRDKSEQIVRRVDAVERDIIEIKEDVKTVIVDVAEHKEIQQRFQGGIWIIRTIMLGIAGVMGAVTTVIMQKVFGR